MTGCDFTLTSGDNAIGRNPGAAITLTGDAGIMERNHAVLSFDPVENAFALRPGSGNSWVNGQPLVLPLPLRPGDKLKFGSTNLVFIPLTGERFRWS